MLAKTSDKLKSPEIRHTAVMSGVFRVVSQCGIPTWVTAALYFSMSAVTSQRSAEFNGAARLSIIKCIKGDFYRGDCH